jgi:hypothetical protein
VISANREGITGDLHHPFIPGVAIEPSIQEAKKVAADDQIVFDDDDASKSLTHIGDAMGDRTRETPVLVTFDDLD